MINTVDYRDHKVILIDQTKLPERFETVELSTWQECGRAIKDMVVRGAPAIGVAGALGMVLASNSLKAQDAKTFFQELQKIGQELVQVRPTAVNLRWGIERIIDLVQKNRTKSVSELQKIIEAEGQAMIAEDIAINKEIGRQGLKIFTKNNMTIQTHCNAGALATVGYGTALGVIRAGWAAGKVKEVFADETRPRLQGGKLTAWELVQDKIPVTVIADNMAAYFMQQKKIDAVVVGADRIASNGDACNKIGTYGLAILAKAHKVPFYVAAPISTIDFRIKSSKEIPIEDRDHQEMTHINGQRVLADGIMTVNPSFDVTPAKYITGIITEQGIFKPQAIKKIQRRKYAKNK